MIVGILPRLLTPIIVCYTGCYSVRL